MIWQELFINYLENNMESIVFGGGCFWCTEAVFKSLKGVKNVSPGYAGGNIPNPSYEEVCNGTTGHAEVIKIDYDPSLVKLRDLMTVFFASHDPTTLNRQGNDIGTQYRSVILYENENQKKIAEDFIKEIDNSASGNPVVTEVKKLDKFYPAEEYHRDYFARNPEKAYCQLVINPKLEKVQKEFAELLAK